ncbi:hypothetical protein SF83666_a39980 (plasmid) [Sinorhizobium fredii CCBAU 83666]|nr:hypothetical protein SF83666_a39980 [Sinorhizobium fredii CCBAU 83666]
MRWTNPPCTDRILQAQEPIAREFFCLVDYLVFRSLGQQVFQLIKVKEVLRQPVRAGMTNSVNHLRFEAGKLYLAR